MLFFYDNEREKTLARKLNMGMSTLQVRVISVIYSKISKRYIDAQFYRGIQFCTERN